MDEIGQIPAVIKAAKEALEAWTSFNDKELDYAMTRLQRALKDVK